MPPGRSVFSLLRIAHGPASRACPQPRTDALVGTLYLAMALRHPGMPARSLQSPRCVHDLLTHLSPAAAERKDGQWDLTRPGPFQIRDEERKPERKDGGRSGGGQAPPGAIELNDPRVGSHLPASSREPDLCELLPSRPRPKLCPVQNQPATQTTNTLRCSRPFPEEQGLHSLVKDAVQKVPRVCGAIPVDRGAHGRAEGIGAATHQRPPFLSSWMNILAPWAPR